MVGKTLGSYHIDARVSTGGMGAVYLATHTDTGRIAAVKVLRPALAADRTFLQRFRREVHALQKIDHPNVVRIYDVGSEDGLQYYAMEYLERSLDDLVRKGPMETRDALRTVAQAAHGLEAVHKAGIFHRDVKPSNILLDPNGRAKVSDFGIAKVGDATRMTQTGTIVGTPTYMAPEQVESADVNARADIYSLGVVLYEAVVGKPPFDGNTALDILRKHRFSLPDPPKSFNPRLPGSLSHLIMGMLAKSPSKRPASMAMVAAALEHIHQNLSADTTTPVTDRRELTSTELHGHYERSAARVAFWAKRIALVLILALIAYIGTRVVAHLRRGPDDYLRDATALKNTDDDQALATYKALLRRYPDSTEAEQARRMVETIRQRQLERATEAAVALSIGTQDTTARVRSDIAAKHLARADSLARQGEIDHAQRVYLHVRDHFADTPWAVRADERLRALEAGTPLPPEATPGPGQARPDEANTPEKPSPEPSTDSAH